jgi:long-subunit acyl-CoA synthetase (AMP-forming)
MTGSKRNWHAGGGADLRFDLRDALHLRDDGQIQGRGAVEPQHHRSVQGVGRIRPFAESDEVLAYLPMAWVGDFIFSIGQAYWTGFCVNCPESPATMYENLHEIGPSYFFAPPRYFEERITILMIRMEDAKPLKRNMFHYFMNHARKVGRS